VSNATGDWVLESVDSGMVALGVCGENPTLDKSGQVYGESVAIICLSWHIVSMEFANLLKIVGEEPVFETSLLLAGEVDPADVRRQLSRWTTSGRLHQLRRGQRKGDRLLFEFFSLI